LNRRPADYESYGVPSTASHGVVFQSVSGTVSSTRTALGDGRKSCRLSRWLSTSNAAHDGVHWSISSVVPPSLPEPYPPSATSPAGSPVAVLLHCAVHAVSALVRVPAMNALHLRSVLPCGTRPPPTPAWANPGPCAAHRPPPIGRSCAARRKNSGNRGGVLRPLVDLG
jgi:hypothetical protein